MTHITSRQNPMVQHAVRLLTDASYRAETGEFAAEGTKLFADALEAGIVLTSVLVSEGTEIDLSGLQTHRVDASIDHDGVSGVSQSRDSHIAQLPQSLFERISTHRAPQGVIFTAKRPQPRSSDIRLVLDGVQDPGNVGTVLRTAAALGIGAVLLTGGCADAFSHKAVRASMGGVFRLSIHRCNVSDVTRYLNGKTLLCATPSPQAQDVRKVDWSGCAAVVGSEGQGVSDAVMAQCGGEFTIPMQSAESLNVAAAAAIILWELTGKC